MFYIIGIGIEGKDSLSKKALGLIYSASLLIGGKRHLELFSDFKGERLIIDFNIERLLNSLNERNYFDERIVCLATGDPNLFGIARSIIGRFGKEVVEVIPNVSIMQEAFARIKESWEDARFISLHARDMDGVVEVIERHSKVGIFTDPKNTPSLIADTLLKKGISDYKVYVCEDLGSPRERITEGTLLEIAERDFSPLNVMVLIKEGLRGQGGRGSREEGSRHSSLTTGQFFGIPDSEFIYERGMITKEEIRSIVLGKLSLKEDSMLWDIGAGSGAVSIEASRIVRKGKVYAIEKREEALRLIEGNKRRFSAINLKVVAGEAPDVLGALPEPDSIFIGGSGGKLKEILTYALGRLKRDGRIVLNFTILGNLLEALSLLKEKGFDYEVLHVSIARSEPLSGGIYLKAINPVFIVTAKRCEEEKEDKDL